MLAPAAGLVQLSAARAAADLPSGSLPPSRTPLGAAASPSTSLVLASVPASPWQVQPLCEEHRHGVTPGTICPQPRGPEAGGPSTPREMLPFPLPAAQGAAGRASAPLQPPPPAIPLPAWCSHASCFQSQPGTPSPPLSSPCPPSPQLPDSVLRGSPVSRFRQGGGGGSRGLVCKVSPAPALHRGQPRGFSCPSAGRGPWHRL